MSGSPYDDDRLSAYLDGELDPTETAELEARLAADPALAAELDAIGDVVVELRGLDEVDPPEGYLERLRARLAQERAPTAERSASARHRVWLAAAAVALVGLLGGGVLVSERSGERVGFSQAARLPAAPGVRGSGGTPPKTMGGPGGTPPVADAEPEKLERSEATAGPVLVDAGIVLPDEAAAYRSLSGLPEAARLLDMPLDQAANLAAAHRLAVSAAPPFRSGVAPGACLDRLAAAGDPPLVVARVESLLYDRRPALAYVLVGASDGAVALDHIQVQLVEPNACTPRLVLTPAGAGE